MKNKNYYLSVLITFSLFVISGVVAELGAQNLGRKEGIHGTVIDSKTGEKLNGVSVQVTNEAHTYATITDNAGRYYIKAEPGVYNVRITSVVHNTVLYQDIHLKQGEVVSLNTQLIERNNLLKDAEVISRANEFNNTESMMLIQQKNSVSIEENVSSEFITKTPDRTTADALKRMGSVSVADDRFAVIRGLSERYNTVMVNGIPLASSETDKKAFALDLIPTQLLDNLSLKKTATPDLPGDFSGGLIKLRTLEVPASNSFFVNLGSEYNSLTTFKDFMASPDRGNIEKFGLLNQNRMIPAGTLPSDQSLTLDHTKDADKITAQTNLFSHKFSPVQQSSAAPNRIFQIGGSKRFKIGKNEFGIIGMLSYNQSNQYTPFSVNYLREISYPNTPPDIRQGSNYNLQSYKNVVQPTSILNLSYQIRRNTQLFLKNLLVFTSEDETVTRSGFKSQSSVAYQENDVTYYYKTNRLYAGQLGVKHTFERSKIKLECTFGYNNIFRNLPDYKTLVYSSTYDNTSDQYYQPLVGVKANAFNAAYDPGVSGRYFSTMNDHTLTVNYAVTIPAEKLKSSIKVGGLMSNRSRDYTARSFLYTYTDGSNVDLTLGRDSIFAPNNLGADKMYLYETTKKSDKYTASSLLASFFVMGDSRFFNKMRAVYGVRLEQYNQKLSSYNINTPVNIDSTVLDILPSANLIYNISVNSNLRLSYFSSVSRPEFREIAPLSFFDISSLSVVTGNPNLVRTKIHNFDIKYEYFPANGSILSVNPFYKTFKDPIELYNLNIPSDNAQYTYANFKGGYSLGVEFDVRVNLRKVDSWIGTNALKDFSWFINYSVIYSSANLDKYEHSSIFYFNPDYTYRPLQGQSPYLVNTGLLYTNEKHKIDFALTANRIGRRINYVASNAKFIIWENPRTVIDFSIAKTFYKKFQARFIIANILPQDRIMYQDANFENSVKFSNNWNPFNEQHYDASKNLLNYRYKYGSTYSISLGYTF